MCGWVDISCVDSVLCDFLRDGVVVGVAVQDIRQVEEKMRYRKLEWSDWEDGNTQAECPLYSDGFKFIVCRWPGTVADYYIGESCKELIGETRKLHFWDIETAKAHCEILNRQFYDSEMSLINENA